MFTGLIEAVGSVNEIKSAVSGYRVRIGTPLAAELAPGDSLAVNGACLTVVLADAAEVHADIGPETARVTTLGTLRRGQRVNLERPMRADARFGGHFVQGHVDGTGVVEEVRTEGESRWLTIAFRPEHASHLVHRGSIAVDGVSLTLAGLGAGRFDVMILPYTWERTSLATLRVGDRVNLECDVLGKYVARALEVAGAKSPTLQTKV